MSFYLGLSLLSNNKPGRGDLHHEGLRVLGLLDQGNPVPGALGAEPGGKPYFTDRHADFNISHSGAMAAVSFSRGDPAGGSAQAGPSRTGCDIQQLRRPGSLDTIGDRFFHPQERDYAAAAEKNLRLHYLWVLKECFLKVYGASVFDMAQTPVFVPGQEPPAFRPNPRNPGLTFYLYELEHQRYGRYVLAAAWETGFPARPEVYWFSQNKLSVRAVAEMTLPAQEFIRGGSNTP
jgi:phosphopantetheinyl transferase